MPFDSVKVFSATMAEDRRFLGEKVSAWLQAMRGIEIHEIEVKQSSDASFHCISIIVFYTRAIHARTRTDE